MSVFSRSGVRVGHSPGHHECLAPLPHTMPSSREVLIAFCRCCRQGYEVLPSYGHGGWMLQLQVAVSNMSYHLV
jgi:hypothetical protein